MRFKVLIFLSACIFGFIFGCIAPSPSFAQSADTGAPAKPAGNKDAHPALRGFAEAGMGLVLGTVAGSIPLLTGVGIQYHDLKHYGNPFRRPYINEITLISTAILYPAGVASGAILGGYLTDSRSDYWEPFVGAYAGAIFADITAYFLMDDYPIFSAILVIILPVITTTLAVETSHMFRKNKEDRRKKRDSGTAFMPLSLKFAF